MRTRRGEVAQSHFPPIRRGEALVNAGGVLRKVYFFVPALPHSDAVFVQAFRHTCPAADAGFLQLQSHYRFAEHFCGVNRSDKKGAVEATVKFARVVTQCRRVLGRTLRGQSGRRKARNAGVR